MMTKDVLTFNVEWWILLKKSLFPGLLENHGLCLLWKGGGGGYKTEILSKDIRPHT